MYLQFKNSAKLTMHLCELNKITCTINKNNKKLIKTVKHDNKFKKLLTH